jgi:hypothetical protein
MTVTAFCGQVSASAYRVRQIANNAAPERSSRLDNITLFPVRQSANSMKLV